MEKLKVGEKGLLIPQEIIKKLGLKPGEEVIVRRRYHYLILEKPKKEYGKKIVNLLKEGLKGVEWNEIEKEREDREW